MKHNWEHKRLGEVCNFIGGGTPSKSNDEFYTGSIPWATVRDMVTFKLDKTELYITEDAVNNSATNILPKGMIVISTHVGLGKICELMQDTAINQDLKGISFTDNSIDKYFFTYWYRSIANFIISKGRGATVKGVTLDFMRELKIPVPPREVQERIVAELDKINEVIEDCRELLRKLDDLAQSLFYDYFGDPVTNPKGWEMMFLKDILNKIGSGATPKGGKESYLGGNVSLIRSLNVYNTYFKYEELAKINDKQAYELRNVEVKNDDVLLNITGASVARCFIAPTDTLPARVNQHVAILRPKSQFLQSIYLHRLIIATSFQNELITISRGKNATREALPKAIIEKIAIPVPPLVLQEEFAERIERIEAQKKAVEQTIAELQTLLDSRMDYWFN